jgi:uncharacterized protein (DUF736 family)
MSDINANDTANKPQREELGALWKRQGQNQTYLTGYINKPNGEKMKIVVFSSKNKKSENQPDFRIYESIPMEGRPPESASTTSVPKSAAPATKASAYASKPFVKKAPVTQEDDDGIL